MRLFKRLLLALTIIYVVHVAITYYFQRDFMYLTHTTPPTLSETVVPEMQDVTIPTRDGLKLHGWYHPAKEGKTTVLFLHGNAGNVFHRGHKARALIDAGYGILLFDYRGYGHSEGSPTEEGLYIDAIAALDFTDIKAGDMVYWGESIGTGVAAWLASEEPPLGLILETPYTTMEELVAKHYYRHIPFAERLVKDKYDVINNVRDLQNVPLLVMHGTSDLIVPYTYGKAVYEAAGEPKQFWSVEGGEHNNLHAFSSLEAVVAFLDTL